MKTHTRIIAASAASALALVLCAGCKTKAAPDAGFLQNSSQMGEQKGRFPFQRVWVKSGASKENYDKVVIAPVNTTYLMEATGWKKANPGNLALDNAVKDLAVYTHDTFRDAFNNPEKNRFKAVENAGARTLTLELAIVELIPSKAALNAMSIVYPDMAVSVAAGVAAGKPSIAIEGRVRDASTGEVLFQFADREEPQVRVVNLQGLTWWSHGKEAIRDWAAQCVELANTPADQQVKDRLPFTLKPWSN